MLFKLCILAQLLYQEPWGKDSDLKATSPKSTRPPHSLSVEIAHQIIRFHQTVISPIDGPRSHFRPSSSTYMKLAMENYGFIQGFLMGCDRLLREDSEEWVYQTIEDDGKIFKYDPPRIDKHPR
jgi:hypothetical protein